MHFRELMDTSKLKEETMNVELKLLLTLVFQTWSALHILPVSMDLPMTFLTVKL